MPPIIEHSFGYASIAGQVIVPPAQISQVLLRLGQVVGRFVSPCVSVHEGTTVKQIGISEPVLCIRCHEPHVAVVIVTRAVRWEVDVANVGLLWHTLIYPREKIPGGRMGRCVIPGSPLRLVVGLYDCTF